MTFDKNTDKEWVGVTTLNNKCAEGLSTDNVDLVKKYNNLIITDKLFDDNTALPFLYWKIR